MFTFGLTLNSDIKFNSLIWTYVLYVLHNKIKARPELPRIDDHIFDAVRVALLFFNYW